MYILRRMRLLALLVLLVLALPSGAVAQTVDACKVFTLEMAQSLAGKAATQGRNLTGRDNGACWFKDASGYETQAFMLWRMSSADESAKYMQADMKTAIGARGGALEKVPNLGDEAYYLPSTWQLYVRKGATWFSFGVPDKKTQMIEMARKIAATF